MNRYDEVLSELGRELGSLSPRPAAGIYASFAFALRGEFLAWLDRSDDPDVQLIDHGIAGAYRYASGEDPSGLSDALAKLEERTPPGEASNGTSPQFAQDCWICADTAIRIAVDPSFQWGPVVEYALEPVVTVTTEELFGVSQLGSAPDEERKLQAVLDDVRVRDALAFCRWAVHFASGQTTLRPADREMLSIRGTALIPHR